MSFLFPKIKTPEPAKLAPPPDRSDAEIQEAAAEQRRRFFQESSGRRSTLGGGLGGLTGGLFSTARLLGNAA